MLIENAYAAALKFCIFYIPSILVLASKCQNLFWHNSPTHFQILGSKVAADVESQPKFKDSFKNSGKKDTLFLMMYEG